MLALQQTKSASLPSPAQELRIPIGAAAAPKLEQPNRSDANDSLRRTDKNQDQSLTLPNGKLTAGVWDSDTLKDYFANIILLNSKDIESIENALQNFKDLGLDIPLVSPENFPLPETLVGRLRSVSKIAHDGVGFAIVRGINPEEYNDEDNVIIFNGLSSHVGCLRSTNQKGVSMSHLRDAQKDHRPEDRKTAELNASKLPQGMKFHADRFYGDMIAMYVKSDDAIGGDQYLASFPAIYNELLETSPQTLRILAKNWSWGNSKENADQPKSPVIFPASNNRVIVQLIYRPFLDSGFSSAAEESALATVQATAERLCIKLDRQPGDLQFVNNFSVLHARDKYTNSSSKGRHMLRLGLRDPENAWEVPEQWRGLFDELFQVRPEDQTIFATDVDPWELTTASINHHG
ncbi:Clavaminate synthase-like protein [Viridothelium virens]|uniref:Clavaminate synthase-like protein n=1 Tax=Viridothelium virens TaxID=1048519 RepID=A0A6A6HJH6_VIRVR|nr:Clavaminate synthase-like protein [Viridothelium virens]